MCDDLSQRPIMHRIRRNHLFVVDPDGFPGNYAKLPPPVRVDPHVLGLVADWLVLRLN
jgi:hypothetical protein